jgi:hypothetical protein
MRTNEIKVWNGQDEATDYMMKDNEWSKGRRVRVIATKAARKVHNGGSSYSRYSYHTNHDGVLVIHLMDDGTPNFDYNYNRDDTPESMKRLPVEMTIPRFIVGEWNAEKAKVAKAAELKAQREVAKAARRREVLETVRRANVLLTIEGEKYAIDDYKVDQYGSVTLTSSQLSALVARAERA